MQCDECKADAAGEYAFTIFGRVMRYRYCMKHRVVVCQTAMKNYRAYTGTSVPPYLRHDRFKK